MQKYNMRQYWEKEGKEHPNDRSKLVRFLKGVNKINKLQEKMLPDIIYSLKPKSVLEIGCGWGRMTKIVSTIPSIYNYVAIDISSDRIFECQKDNHIPNVNFIQCDFMEQNFPFKYDLVFASEVLMHIPPNMIQEFINKMASLSLHNIVSLDYYDTSLNPKKLYRHNFNHKYFQLYLNVSTHVNEIVLKPYKQSIFTVEVS